MKLTDLKIIQNITPRWGAGHFLARHQSGELLEVLVAEQSSESVTSLLSWGHALERISHPSVPKIQTIVHQETTFIALRLQDGISLSQALQAEEHSLSRLDLLNAFYQLATALKKLHEHELNHGNLTLDHMKLVGEGWLQLRGWTPPAIETTFTLRKVDELKRFKNFFYMSIVGQFPPTQRNQATYSDQKLTPFQLQCLEAWGQWYHQESTRPRPNLSTTRLMLFDEPPSDSQELVDELTPFVDHHFKAFYQKLVRSLEERESFAELYQRRQSLLGELERAHRITQLWLHQNADERSLGERQVAKLEQLLISVSQNQQQLERLSGQQLSQAQIFINEHSHLIQQGAHTQLYESVGYQSDMHSNEVLTLERALTDLDTRWALVDPNRPLHVSPQEAQILNESSLGSTQGGRQGMQQLLALNDLPKFDIKLNHNLESYDSRAPSNPLPWKSSDSANYSALGIEPLPSHIEIPSLPSDIEPGSTQIFRPSNEEAIYTGEEPKENLASPSIFAPLVPGGTRTAFTQHMREYEGAEFFNPESTQEPRLAFSHKNFFAFLYLSAALVFFWSLREQGPTTTNQVSTQNQASYTQDAQDPPQTSPSEDPHRSSTASVTQTTLEEKSTAETDVINSSEREAGSDQSSNKEILSHFEPPQAPERMVYIPGGTLTNGLSESAYNKVVAHCIFEPDYSGRDRRSKERCKRLIPHPKEEPSTVNVGPFFIDVYEVSRGDYKQYCREGGVCNQRLNFREEELELPVVNVSMIQAMDYCHFYQKSLPNYEQWLFAARGESEALYPWGNDSVLEGGQYRANYKSKLSKPKRRRQRKEIDGFTGVHSVHHLPELGLSPYGVAHLAGNVREWVSRDRRRLGWVTGGSWKQAIWDLRLTQGEYLDQFVETGDDIGFRCAKKIDIEH